MFPWRAALELGDFVARQETRNAPVRRGGYWSPCSFMLHRARVNPRETWPLAVHCTGALLETSNSCGEIELGTSLPHFRRKNEKTTWVTLRNRNRQNPG